MRNRINEAREYANGYMQNVKRQFWSSVFTGSPSSFPIELSSLTHSDNTELGQHKFVVIADNVNRENLINNIVAINDLIPILERDKLNELRIELRNNIIQNDVNYHGVRGFYKMNSIRSDLDIPYHFYPVAEACIENNSSVPVADAYLAPPTFRQRELTRSASTTNITL